MSETLSYIKMCNDANQLARFGSPLTNALRLELEALQASKQILKVKYAGPGFGYVTYRHTHINHLIDVMCAQILRNKRPGYMSMLGELVMASNDPSQEIALDIGEYRDVCVPSRQVVLDYIRNNPLCTRKQVVESTNLPPHIVGARVRDLIRDRKVTYTKIAGIAAEVLQHVP